MALHAAASRFKPGTSWLRVCGLVHLSHDSSFHQCLKSNFPLCGVGRFISLMAVLHALLSVGSMWVILDARLSSVVVSPHVLRGSPTWFPPSNWEIKILWSQWVCSLIATCPYHLSLLFLITCPILTRPIDSWAIPSIGITNQRFWALILIITLCSTPMILVSLNIFIRCRGTHAIT